jgi:hypothetical protein
VLQQVAHLQVHRRGDEGRGQAEHFLAAVDVLARIGRDGEADDMKVAVALHVGFLGGVEHRLGGDRAVRRAEQDGDGQRGERQAAGIGLMRS